jgi:hypothetical protein
MAAPNGNTNAVKGKLARVALDRALEIRSPTDRHFTLIQIWDKLIDDAIDGDKQAAAMIIDRLDGKPRQEVDVALTQHESALDDLK